MNDKIHDPANDTDLKSPPFAALPLVPEGKPDRPLRICIASFDLVGPIRNGGVGTAFTSMAEALAAAGHEVTLLYLSGQWCENKTLDHWVAEYQKKGIQFVPLPETVDYPMIAAWHQRKSFETYLYLKDQIFDIIHFSEWRGPGYYSIMARHQGLAFAQTQICVHTHGPTFWSRLSNGEYIREPEDMDLDYLERKSVALADTVVSPSQYLFRWMLKQDWTLTEKAYVQQYVRPATARSPRPLPEGGRIKPDELVFFGRLEVRKGLVLFCDALDRLKDEPDLKSLKVTFLGKHTEVDGEPSQEYLTKRARLWPWDWQILSDKDQAGAMDYLQSGSRLALMPSLADNLPNTVLECLGARVAFLTSDIGGIPEMIDARDQATVCLPLHVGRLAQQIQTAVREGIKPADPALDPTENERAWVRWHETQVPAGETGQDLELASTEAQPKVSICISHFNRPKLLQQAIASVEAQDYSNIELVLVDDASTDAEAIHYVDSLEPVFQKRGWLLIRNESEQFVGAARNRAAQQAQGEYLLFMDDDNCAKPHEVSTFVRAAQNSGADIVTCFLDFFSGYEPPATTDRPMHRVLFLGDALSGGALRNTFGDTNALIRRQAFLDLGGFHERRDVGHEDWQLYADAILKGYHLEVVPDALVWYRRNESERFATRTNSLHAGHMQNIKPYLDAVPASLRNLILFAQGQSLQLEKGEGQTATAVANSKFTIQWRALFEAACVVARLGHQSEAIHLMLDAVKAAESSQHPSIILDALLHVGKELITLDSNRARQALQLAEKLAQGVKNEAAYKQAQGLLVILSKSTPVSTSTPPHAPSPTAPATPSGPIPAVSPQPSKSSAQSVPRRPVGIQADLNPRAGNPTRHPSVHVPQSQSPTPAPGSSPRTGPHTESGPTITSAERQTPIEEILRESADLLNANRNAEALALMDRFISAHPQGSRLHFGRAIVLARLGRNREARETLLKLSPQERSGPRVQRLLEELGAQNNHS